MKKRATPRRHRSPSPEKTARTRRAILEAATEVFLATGFSDARMEDIASRAGVAKGLLYVYFPDKLALFASVVEQLAQKPLGSFEQFDPGSGESARAFLLRTVPPLLHNFTDSQRGALLRLVLAEGARFPAIGDAYRRHALVPLWKGIEQLARVALANGELRSDTLVRFPQVMTLPALMSAVGPVLQDDRAPPPEEIFAALVEAFFVEK